MRTENLETPKKHSAIESLTTGAISGLIFSLCILFAIYFVAKIVLA